jgi:hypothetical protein
VSSNAAASSLPRTLNIFRGANRRYAGHTPRRSPQTSPLPHRLASVAFGGSTSAAHTERRRTGPWRAPWRHSDFLSFQAVGAALGVKLARDANAASERSGIIVWTEQDPAAAGGGWRSPASAEPRCVALAHPRRPPLHSGARYRRRRTPTSRSTGHAHAAVQDPSRGRRRRDDLRSHVASTRARPRAESRSRSFSSLEPCNGERPGSRVVHAPRREGT